MKTPAKILISVCVFVLSAFLCARADGQVLAVKTNALMWAGATPNLGLEMVTGEHTSIDLSGFGHKNPYGLKSRMISLQPEFRYWFNGRPMVREFVGITALFTTYDMTLPQNIFGKDAKNSPMQVNDGDSIGLGITGGYVFELGKRFNLELSCGFGAVYYRQKQYPADSGDNYGTDNSQGPNSRGYKLIPIDLGVTFTYILK